MEKRVYDSLKYVEIWLTRAEAADMTVRQALKPLYTAYKLKKYRVAVFESGCESLPANTKDLLRHAVQTEAQRELSV